VRLPPIFREYDIRGVADTQLGMNTVYDIGRVLGRQVIEQGDTKVAIGRDARLSSPALSIFLQRGLIESGAQVIDLGAVTTPMLYFAALRHAQGNGIMLTGSHNPPEYNGLKLMFGGQTLHGDAIRAIYPRMQEVLPSGEGGIETLAIMDEYRRALRENIQLQPGLHLVVDCGNGVAGPVVSDILQAFGCQVECLFCDPNGHFPNHHPDPSISENLRFLQQRVLESGADLGLAFDGDGDRLGMVDNLGTIIWPDRILMLLARAVLQQQAGATIIHDVKCGYGLKEVIEAQGGTPLMWRTGHSNTRGKLLELEAPLAGELSGHIFYNDRWPALDDALYAALRMLETVQKDGRSVGAIFADFPDYPATPELHICMSEGEPQRLMQAMLQHDSVADGRVITLDGLRVEFDDGWGLMRASNTTPDLVMRFEGRDRAALYRIIDLFEGWLMAIAPELRIPFTRK
jgi:phosphomannomutase/phosphoglucomutase